MISWTLCSNNVPRAAWGKCPSTPVTGVKRSLVENPSNQRIPEDQVQATIFLHQRVRIENSTYSSHPTTTEMTTSRGFVVESLIATPRSPSPHCE